MKYFRIKVDSGVMCNGFVAIILSFYCIFSFTNNKDGGKKRKHLLRISVFRNEIRDFIKNRLQFCRIVSLCQRYHILHPSNRASHGGRREHGATVVVADDA